MRFKTALMAAAALLSASAASATTTFLRTYEAPGVLNTTVNFDFSGVETFDNRPTGYQSFQTDFGGNGMVGGTIMNVQVNNGDIYGGAMGSHYAYTGNDPITISLDTEVTYFGFWLSALNAGNLVTFFKGNEQLASYDASTVFDGVQDLGLYKCMPSGPNQGANCGEPYAFVNFFSVGGGFDRIQLSGPGVEADNFTVGRYATGETDVPEPGTIGLLGMGVALAAVGRRRRRRG
jgi:hypothetical protein